MFEKFASQFNRIRLLDILERTTEEEIFEFYLDVPNIHERYYSPFDREDQTPGCRFQQYAGRWYFIDNGRYKGKLQFTCFQLVQYMDGLTFPETCKRIWKDMALAKKPILPRSRQNQYKIGSDYECIIKFTHRPWEKGDVFNRLGIPPKYLNTQPYYKVVDYWTNTRSDHSLLRNRFGIDTDSVAYYFRETDRTKLYLPNGNKVKWVSNCTTEDIFGYHRMDDYLYSNEDTLIITKSGKDELVLHYHTGGACTLGVQSESPTLPERIKRVLKYFKKVIIIFDNDQVGQKASMYLRGTINSMFPGKCERFFFNNKDASTEYLKDQREFFHSLKNFKSE